MSVYKHLQKARAILQTYDLKKTGHNKFSNYFYFELGDFIPAIHKIFNEVGLCGVVRFTNDTASLTIYDVEDVGHGSVEFTSPLVYAENTKGQAIQNLGSTHTYMRRYLWLMAMEIVEHDAVDGLPQEEKKPEPKAKKAAPVPMSGKDPERGWNITVTEGADWKDSIVLGVTNALDMAEKLADVENIWKVNRPLFDRLKEDDKATYDDLLSMLGTHKQKFL